MPFEVTILGSSSATPTSDRYPTAQVINARGRYFLTDCGEGTQIQIRRQKIGFGKINQILISHLHGDHYYGLIGMISSFNLLGITNDIHIYSHSQLKELIQPQLDFLKKDLQFKIIFHPLNFKTPEKIFFDEKVEVYSFPLKHSIPCCGFLFKEREREYNIIKECISQYKIPVADIKKIKRGADFITGDGRIIPNNQLTIPPPPPRSYAFCSDTAYYPAIVNTIKNVDLLYHEATFTEELKDWAKNTLHSTALDAAKIAQAANAKKLILGHFSARYKDIDLFLQEAKTIFPETFAAVDGYTFKITH
jgi:ribonuclease Z